MNRLRTLPPVPRLLLATLLALWLAVRLLTPAGFMPAFADGLLAIVECPDGEGAPALPTAMPDMPGMVMADMPGMAPDAHGVDAGKHAFHQACPYAAAASLAGLDAGPVIFAILLLVAFLPPLARTLLEQGRRATRDRPPAQGPPLQR